MGTTSLRQAMENAAKKINEAQSKADAQTIRKAWKRYLPIEKKVYTRIFNDVVTTFYSAHIPTKYERTANTVKHSGGIYNVLDVERARREKSDAFGSFTIGVDDKDPYAMIDPTQMEIQKFGQGKYNAPKIIFETVFEKGYHGGATKIKSSKAKKWGRHPNKGTPYYRRRGYIVADNGQPIKHRWARWFPASSPAIQSPAPKKEFIEATKGIGDVGGELYSKLEQIAREENAKTQKTLVPKLQKIFADEVTPVLRKGGD